MMRAWMVRAGRKGERATVALENGVVIAGWEEVGDLSHIGDGEGLRALLVEIYPEFSSQVVGNWTGQLWRFREEIAVGDLVVIPVSDSYRRRLVVGVVTGTYCYHGAAKPGFRRTRSVEMEAHGSRPWRCPVGSSRQHGVIAHSLRTEPDASQPDLDPEDEDELEPFEGLLALLRSLDR